METNRARIWTLLKKKSKHPSLPNFEIIVSQFNPKITSPPSLRTKHLNGGNPIHSISFQSIKTVQFTRSRTIFQEITPTALQGFHPKREITQKISEKLHFSTIQTQRCKTIVRREWTSLFSTLRWQVRIGQIKEQWKTPNEIWIT